MGNKKVIAVLWAPLFLAFLLGLAWNFNHSREIIPTSAIPGDEDVVFFSEFIKSTTRGIVPGDPAYVRAASLEIDNGEGE